MMAYSEHADPELLSLLRDGDQAAFTAIYERYHQLVYRYLYKFLKSPDLSDDLGQEVFMKVWDGRAELPDLISVKAYLLVLSRNQALNFLRRAGVDQVAKAEILKNYPAAEPRALENELEFADYKRYLEDILAKLSPQSREVFRLCRQEGRTYDETAELLGISRNTVKKHMVRTMKIVGDTVQRDLGISLSILLAIVHHIV